MRKWLTDTGRFLFYTLSIVTLTLIAMCFIKESDYEEGYASYYTEESCRREGTSGITASGEVYDENALTCAMRRRDFGKWYEVVNIKNGRSVKVRHNDFGPNKTLHERGRIIDLSKEAFSRIADLKEGIIKVRVRKMSDLRKRQRSRYER